MIVKCDCKSEFQDKEYGKGNRVYNPMQKSGSRNIVGYRCTICKKTISPKKELEKENKEKNARKVS